MYQSLVSFLLVTDGSDEIKQIETRIGNDPKNAERQIGRTRFHEQMLRSAEGRDGSRRNEFERIDKRERFLEKKDR